MVAEPTRAEQCGRDERRFAGTRGRVQDKRSARRESRSNRRKNGLDWERQRYIALQRVVLADAAADEILQQRVVDVGGGPRGDVRKRIPDVLQHDQQLLGANSFATRLGRGGAEEIVQLRVVRAVTGRSAEHRAQGVDGSRVEADGAGRGVERHWARRNECGC